MTKNSKPAPTYGSSTNAPAPVGAGEQRNAKRPREDADDVVVLSAGTGTTAATESITGGGTCTILLLDDDDSDGVIDVDQEEAGKESVGNDAGRVPVASTTGTRGTAAVVGGEGQQKDDDEKALATRIYLDPGQSEKGWVVKTRLPPHLQVMKPREGLQSLLAAKPQEHGTVLMFGKVVEVPRFQKAYLRNYTFTGSDHAAEKELPPCVQEVLDWANRCRHHWVDRPLPAPAAPAPAPAAAAAVAGAPGTPATGTELPTAAKEEEQVHPGTGMTAFNAALLNWYMDGAHYIGPHADDERQLHKNSPIFTCSIGATRTFRVRDKNTNKVVKDFTVRGGDVLVMGGTMQQHYKHEIVKLPKWTAKLVGPRVSLTFRQFK